MAYQCTLQAPSGVTVATTYQGASGQTYTPNGSSQLVVGDEKDARALIDRGWTIVTVSGGQ